MEHATQEICFCVQRANILFLLQSTSPSTTSWSEALKRIVAQQLRDAFGNGTERLRLDCLARRRNCKSGGRTRHACAQDMPVESCSAAGKTDTHAQERPGVQLKSRELSWKFIREWLSRKPHAAAETDNRSVCQIANDRGSGDDGSEKPHSRLIVLVVKSSLFNSS
jgi:hypothetical protein